MLLGVTLSRRGPLRAGRALPQRLPRIVALRPRHGRTAARRQLPAGRQLCRGAGFLAALWGLALLVAAGIASYFVFAHLTGAMRLGELKSMLKR